MEASFINPLTITILMAQYTTSIAECRQSFIVKKYTNILHLFNANNFSPHKRFCDVYIYQNPKKMTPSKATFWSVYHQQNSNLLRNTITNNSIHTFDWDVENLNLKGRVLKGNTTWTDISIEAL